MSDTTIHNRAMLVSLRLSAWTARKYDKGISNKVAKDFNAQSDAGRYNKMLIPSDAISYKALNQLIGKIRTDYYANTLAWSDEGWRLLPTANYQQFADFTRKAKAEFNALLNDFLAEYPALKENAKMRLNGMYQESDYPTVSQIAGKFGFYLDFSPLPAQGDFRLDLPSDELARLEADKQAQVKGAIDGAMSDAWNRLYTCVKHIHERLSQPDAIFRDSLISNAAELCDILTRLNVTGNPDLENLRAEVEGYIASQDADTLREDDQAREDVATLADDILSRMAAFYSPETEGQ